jgi:hypothetical protein
MRFGQTTQWEKEKDPPKKNTTQKTGGVLSALFLAILFPPVGFLAFKDFFLLFGFPIISVAYGVFTII